MNQVIKWFEKRGVGELLVMITESTLLILECLEGTLVRSSQVWLKQGNFLFAKFLSDMTFQEMAAYENVGVVLDEILANT